MTPTLRAKLREELGPMTSDSKCDAVVRAVLEGIREPTEAMVDAWHVQPGDTGRFVFWSDRRRGYCTMISALLSQGEAVE